MSNSKMVSWILILIVLVSSSGAVYYITSNQYKPKIAELEEEHKAAVAASQQLNITLSDLSMKNEYQNNTIQSLREEKESLETIIAELELELDSLEDAYSETSADLETYRSLAKDFYKMHPIRIGFTASSSDQLSYTENLAEMAENDINNYCQSIDTPYRFEFEIGNNLGLDDVALSNLITYDTLDINLVIGHPWNTQCQVSLDFVNDNDMILLSPSSDINELAQVDNLFRLSPNETMQLRVNVACMKKMGIEHVAIFAKNNDWGHELSETMTSLLEAEGIDSWVLYYNTDPKVSLYAQYAMLRTHLSNATSEFGGSDQVALQLIGDDRLEEFYGIYGIGFGSVVWFSISTTAYKNIPSGKAPEGILLLSPIPVVEHDKFIEFNNRVKNNYDFEVSYFGAAAYDACWLYALAVIDAGSINTELVKTSLENVAMSYEGVSGICTLNGDGDRIAADYLVMGIDNLNGGFTEYGFYSYVNQTVEFSKIHWKIPTN